MRTAKRIAGHPDGASPPASVGGEEEYSFPAVPNYNAQYTFFAPAYFSKKY
jgi:hypothetical protein